MMSIEAPEAEVAAAVAPHAATISIAAVNGPAQVVIAGAAAPVAAIAAGAGGARRAHEGAPRLARVPLAADGPDAR